MMKVETSGTRGWDDNPLYLVDEDQADMHMGLYISGHE